MCSIFEECFKLVYIYKQNSSGPNTDLKIPMFVSWKSDVKVLEKTHWDRPQRYDHNHRRAALENPRLCNFERSFEGKIASKALLKSNYKNSIASFPSTPMPIASVRFISAAWVLLNLRTDEVERCHNDSFLSKMVSDFSPPINFQPIMLNFQYDVEIVLKKNLSLEFSENSKNSGNFFGIFFFDTISTSY